VLLLLELPLDTAPLLAPLELLLPPPLLPEHAASAVAAAVARQATMAALRYRIMGSVLPFCVVSRDRIFGHLFFALCH
jgi:hypothetical protein